MKKIYYKNRIRSIPAQKLERIKICFQFLFVIFVSAFIGIVISKKLSDNFYINLTFRVSTHFETAFVKCSNLLDTVMLVAQSSLSDILSVFVIFIFSFFTFNCVATNTVLIYNGIRFGITSAFLAEFSQNAAFSYNIGATRFAIFVFLKTAFLVILFNYAYYAALSSVKLRAIGDDGRPKINKKEFSEFLIKAVAYIGIVLIINCIYCFFIYVLK